MARALGIGGIFFKCRDRRALAAWYGEHLGLEINELGGCEFRPEVLPRGTYCVWGPFDAATDYFEPSRKELMINLVVDDLDGALEQVVQGGARLAGGIEEHDSGRFGWFVDPEGNKIELWQPADGPVPSSQP